MHASDTLGSVEIAERARDPQDPVISTRRQAHRVRSTAQERQAGRVRSCDLLENSPAHLCICADVAQAQSGVSLDLDVARLRHARGNLSTAFARRRQNEIRRRHGCRSIRSTSGPDNRPWAPGHNACSDHACR
jgi:hypothetical protein